MSLEYLKQLGPEWYKISYAAAIVPILCMYVMIFIATLAEYCTEYQHNIFKSIYNTAIDLMLEMTLIA